MVPGMIWTFAGTVKRNRDPRPRVLPDTTTVGVFSVMPGGDAEFCRHVHQVRERPRLHFAHDPSPMRLHRDLADVEFATNLLVQQSGDDQCHDLPFTWTERFMALAERLDFQL